MWYKDLNEKQKKLFKELLDAIRKNKDITNLLNDKENREDIKAVLTVRNYSDWSSAGSLLFHAIGKEKCAKPLLYYINNTEFKKEVYRALSENLFYAFHDCSNDKAKKIVELIRKQDQDIFKDMLGKYFNKGIVNELSKKNDQIYIYNAQTVINTIKKQNKCDNYYAGTASCGAVLVVVAVVAAVSLYEYTMMATTNLKGRDVAAQFFALGTIVSIFALLGVITCLCIALTSKPTVEKLQNEFQPAVEEVREELKAKQKSQHDTKTQLPSSSMKEESEAKSHIDKGSLGKTL